MGAGFAKTAAAKFGRPQQPEQLGDFVWVPMGDPEVYDAAIYAIATKPMSAVPGVLNAKVYKAIFRSSLTAMLQMDDRTFFCPDTPGAGLDGFSREEMLDLINEVACSTNRLIGVFSPKATREV